MLIAQQLPYKVNFVNPLGQTNRTLSGRCDSVKFARIIKSEHSKLMRKGHVLASLTIFEIDSTYKADISIGETYLWGRFNVNNVPEALLSKAGYHRNQFANTRINTVELGKLMVKIIMESDKTGFPFATIALDSVSVNGGEISAVVNYSAGLKIEYASLKVNSAFVKSNYLESYLGIKEGTDFNAIKVANIRKKINKLTYAKTDKQPQIKFDNKSCKITLKVDPVKANQVDAMLGLAPNQIDKSKLLATGYINLDLHNLFKSGKRLTFNWRQFAVQSQMLNARYNHTNLFGSTINVQGKFELFKQDTAFINRNFYIDVGYDDANYAINFTSTFITSRLLSATNTSSSAAVELIDFNTQYYGVNFAKTEFDNRINPRKGWDVKSALNIGSKTVLATSFVPIEVSDSLKGQSLQGKFMLQSSIAVPLGKLVVAYSKIQVGSVVSNGALFNNDLFRLGGVNSIRGFNELEIYASTYTMLQMEGRLLLGENSRLFGFIDLAYTQNNVVNFNDTYVGIGTGLLLNTTSGVMQIVYAVGKSSKQSLSLAESKIHIGYVARF